MKTTLEEAYDKAFGGTFVKLVHQCVVPELRESYGEGTIWQCDCGKQHRVTQFYTRYGSKSSREWRELDPGIRIR